MRIPVKSEYKGYTPALDPFSEDKLVWFKRKYGLPTIIFVVYSIFMSIGAYFWFWALIPNAGHHDDINVYKELGHDKFVLLFVIAALIGLLGYFWTLFVYDVNETKKYSLDESIDIYKKAPIRTKAEQYNQQQSKEKLWWAIPGSVLMFGGGFLMFFDDSLDESDVAVFGVYLLLVSMMVYAILYYPTVIRARKYLDRRFKVESSEIIPVIDNKASVESVETPTNNNETPTVSDEIPTISNQKIVVDNQKTIFSDKKITGSNKKIMDDK